MRQRNLELIKGLDKRILSLGIVQDNGKPIWYNDLYITAQGQTWSNTVEGQCMITVINLPKSLRNSILSNTKPMAFAIKPHVQVILKAGRESGGAGIIYVGDVFRTFQTYKPNVGIQFKCTSGYYQKFQPVTRSLDKMTTFKNICALVAKDNNLKLDFKITDFNVKSYSFSGTVRDEFRHLEDICTKCFVRVDYETGTLHVINPSKYKETPEAFIVSAASGLLTITCTDTGVEFEMLYTPSIDLYSFVKIESEINPTLNGLYFVNERAFSLTSRDTDFNLKVKAILPTADYFQ